VDFLFHTCKNRLYRVDDFPIENGAILYLAGDALGEKAYYLLTAVVKEYEGVTQVLLRANSDKSHGLNGFLNEILDNLRHLVLSAEAREIGIIKKEQVINIIDSVVQRTTFAGGEGAASVNIRDSVVHRTEIKEDAEEKRQAREEEKRKIRQEEGRLQREEEERKASEESEKREREEQEKLRREGEERIRREEEEKKGRERKAKAREAAEQREKEKAAQEEKRLIRDREGRAVRERGPSWKVQLGDALLVLVLAVLITLIGVWAIAPDTLGALVPSERSPLPTRTATPDVPPDSGVLQTVSQTPTPAADLEETITNSIGMEFVLIPAGEFDMGSPSDEEGRDSDEGPVHHVKIEKSFYMGRYEVTQKEWREVMGDNPSYFKGDDRPVEQVSWGDIQEFIRKLSEKEGTDKYRLPSEAEWEYACRAGTTTRYSFGDSESKLGDYAWYVENSYYKTHLVGKKKPNPWGLYDMHGNVFEWVQDTYHSDYDGAPTDGSAWENGDDSSRVFRGGSWRNRARLCRSSVRLGTYSGANSYGFRILKET